jgi:hypothetical protein
MDEFVFEDNNNNEINPDDVEKEFDKAIDQISEAHQLLIDSSQFTGYLKEVITAYKPIYRQYAEISENYPELRQYTISGIQMINSIGDSFQNMANLLYPIERQLSVISASTDIFQNTSGSINAEVLCLSPDLPLSGSQISYDPPPRFLPNENEIEQKLSKYDPVLANTYKEIGQVYYATNSDPRRPALVLMRQVYDHFFSILAPDEKVRGSAFFTPKKEPEKADKIFRRERLNYVVETYVNDPGMKDILINSFREMLDTYDLLNKHHSRGILSIDEARRALKSMKSFIELWINATN